MRSLQSRVKKVADTLDQIETARIRAMVRHAASYNRGAADDLCRRYSEATDINAFVQAANGVELLVIQQRYGDFLTRHKSTVPPERIHQLCAQQIPVEQWTLDELNAAVQGVDDLDAYDWEAMTDEDLDGIEAGTAAEQTKIMEKYRKEVTTK